VHPAKRPNSDQLFPSLRERLGGKTRLLIFGLTIRLKKYRSYSMYGQKIGLVFLGGQSAQTDQCHLAAPIEPIDHQRRINGPGSIG
jgi:hypothetical protein